jgi:hypothetical protein
VLEHRLVGIPDGASTVDKESTRSKGYDS